MKLTRTFILSISLFNFIACGGGGGGSANTTPPTSTTITDTNSQNIVTALSRILMGIVLGSGPIEDYIGLKNYTCNPGSFVTNEDAINLTATLTFTNCRSSFSTRYDGSLVLSNPTVAPNTGFDVTFNNLLVSQTAFRGTPNNIEIQIDGTISITLTPSGTTSTYTISSPSLSVTSDGNTHTLKDFNFTGTTQSAGDASFTLTGNLTSTSFPDTVTISTPITFSKASTDRRYPYIGQLLFNGDNNTYLAISTNGGENFTPETDQVSIDVNGIITNQSWDDFRVWAGLLETYSQRHN